jgi:hypothetical protein
LSNWEYAKLVFGNAVVIGLLLFIFKDLIGGYLIKRTENKFSISLAKLESDLRNSEYQIQSTIDESKRKISHIRDTAVSHLFESSAALERKRIDAAQVLWE